MISAHNLPKPQGSGAKGEVIDPYVVLELHGVPADCAEQRTRTAAQNQDDPLFDETFEFQVRPAADAQGLCLQAGARYWVKSLCMFQLEQECIV